MLNVSYRGIVWMLLHEALCKLQFNFRYITISNLFWTVDINYKMHYVDYVSEGNIAS